MSLPQYSFGVEIEVLVEPHKIRPPLNTREKHALYYEKLAKALRNRGLRAQHNDLTQTGQWRSTDYTQWFITRDGSLPSSENLSKISRVPPTLVPESALGDDHAVDS